MTYESKQHREHATTQSGKPDSQETDVYEDHGYTRFQQGGSIPAVDSEFRDRAPPTASELAFGPPGVANAPGARGNPHDLGELRVEEKVVDLGTGSPRDQIQDAVTGIGFAWNETIDNLQHAFLGFVQMIQHAEMKKASHGFISLLWGQAKTRITGWAKSLSILPNLGATLALTGVEKLAASFEKLEEKRQESDENTFIAELEKQVKAHRLEGLSERTNPSVNKAVSALDREFITIGNQNKDDQWKLGDSGVVGKQADFLKNLLKEADDCQSAIPSMSDFEKDFLVQWINFHHKTKHRSPLRSPFADSTFQDGSVVIDAKLSDYVLGYSLAPSDATLHCPKSSEVAKRLSQDDGAPHLETLEVPITVRLDVDDLTKRSLPSWAQELGSREIQFDPIKRISNGRSKQYWDWLMNATHQTTDQFFGRVDKLKG